MDLLATLPDFPTTPYAHILPLLEKAHITVKELLLLDALQVAKQTRAPVADVRKFTAHVLDALHQDLGIRTKGQTSRSSITTAETGGGAGEISDLDDIDNGDTAEFSHRALRPPIPSHISTLDPVLDAALDGGIATGYVTELTGESGTGKTQLLLHLLLSVQLPPPIGLSKRALYVSTEADLPTHRLSQLLAEHTAFSKLPSDTQPPSLENILSVTTVDLETQDHVINYQIPVAVSRYDVGLVIIDSITANYRVESSVDSVSGLLERSWELKKLGYLLRTLAAKHNIAVVVANQVSDRFDTGLDLPFATEELRDLPDRHLGESTQLDSSLPPATEPSGQPQPISNHQPSQFDGVATSSAIAQVPRRSESPPAPSQQLDDDYNDGRPVIRIPKLDSVLRFEYQQPFFTGWGNPSSHLRGRVFSPIQSLKTPALGLVWTNQIGCRIVLKFKQGYMNHGLGNLNNMVPATVPEPAASDLGGISAVIEDTPIQPAISKDTTLETHGNEEERTSIPASPRNDNDHQEALTPYSEFPEAGPGVNGDTVMTVSPSGTRIRQMQVVFCPWATGIPHQRDNNHINTNTLSLEPDSMYDPVEFEILPHGIRGIR